MLKIGSFKHLNSIVCTAWLPYKSPLWLFLLNGCCQFSPWYMAFQLCKVTACAHDLVYWALDSSAFNSVNLGGLGPGTWDIFQAWYMHFLECSAINTKMFSTKSSSDLHQASKSSPKPSHLKFCFPALSTTVGRLYSDQENTPFILPSPPRYLPDIFEGKVKLFLKWKV